MGIIEIIRETIKAAAPIWMILRKSINEDSLTVRKNRCIESQLGDNEALSKQSNNQ